MSSPLGVTTASSDALAADVTSSTPKCGEASQLGGIGAKRRQPTAAGGASAVDVLWRFFVLSREWCEAVCSSSWLCAKKRTLLITSLLTAALDWSFFHFNLTCSCVIFVVALYQIATACCFGFRATKRPLWWWKLLGLVVAVVAIIDYALLGNELLRLFLFSLTTIHQIAVMLFEVVVHKRFRYGQSLLDNISYRSLLCLRYVGLALRLTSKPVTYEFDGIFD